MPFKIASWNVNSLRVRLPHLTTWLAQEQPDVVALQEIKVEDKDFPVAEIAAAGYQAVFSGQKTYNGVALLSKLPLDKIETSFPNFIDEQRRVLTATLGDIRIINLYVPNGSSVGSEKYEYKLNWLQQLKYYLQAQLLLYPKLIVLGDFNIAPADRDVHDPKMWDGSVLVSPPERAALADVMADNLLDAFRLFEEGPGHYTWWDYRLNAFKRNLGLRIDHIIISHALKPQCQSCYIDKTPRSWERPSDHAPIIATFI
jgi:exodeoxyribonuclease-3